MNDPQRLEILKKEAELVFTEIHQTDGKSESLRKEYYQYLDKIKTLEEDDCE